MRQLVSGGAAVSVAMAKVEHVRQGGPGQPIADERHRAPAIVHVAFVMASSFLSKGCVKKQSDIHATWN